MLPTWLASVLALIILQQCSIRGADGNRLAINLGDLIEAAKESDKPFGQTKSPQAVNASDSLLQAHTDEQEKSVHQQDTKDSDKHVSQTKSLQAVHASDSLRHVHTDAEQKTVYQQDTKEGDEHVAQTKSLQAVHASDSLLHVHTDVEQKSAHQQDTKDTKEGDKHIAQTESLQDVGTSVSHRHVHTDVEKKSVHRQEHGPSEDPKAVEVDVKRHSSTVGSSFLVVFVAVLAMALCYGILGRRTQSNFRCQDLKRADGGSFFEGLDSIKFQSVASFPMDLLLPEWTEEAVMQILEEHKMPCDGWTDAMKSDLVHDLDTGRARLVLRDAKLVHEVSVCMIFLVDKKSGRLIQELPRSTDWHQHSEMVPNSKILSSESLHDATRRTLSEKLDIACKKNSSSIVEISPDCLFHVTETESCDSTLPGLPCIIRKLFVSATVKTTDAAQLKKICLPDGILEVANVEYRWKKIQECSSIKQEFRDFLLYGYVAALVVEPSEAKGSRFDGLVLPWQLQDILEVTQAHGVLSPEETFGKSLMDLARLLKEGRVTFAVDRSNGQLMCVEESVVCVIRTPHGKNLLAGREALPQMQKFSAEGAWCAALSWLQKEGRLFQPALQLSNRVYDEGHSGLVQKQKSTFDWHLDQENPHCVHRLFLVEGQIR